MEETFLKEIILSDDLEKFIGRISPQKYGKLLRRYYSFFLEAPKKLCFFHIQKHRNLSFSEMREYISNEYVRWCILYKPSVFMFMVCTNIISMDFVDEMEDTYIHFYMKHSYMDNVDLLVFMLDRTPWKMITYSTDKPGDTIFHCFAKNMNITSEEDKARYTFIFYTLIEKGSSVFVKNEKGETALLSLKAMHRKEEYQFLLGLIESLF